MKDSDAIDIAGSLIVQVLQLFLLFVTKSIMMDKCPQFVVNADSSHLIDKLKNEKELRASLRFYFEQIDQDPERLIAKCLLCVKKKPKHS